MTSYEAERHIEGELGPGESLLWSGQPARGLMLTAIDLFIVPFSLLWTGFVVFWEWTALHQGGPPIFALFGLPFVLVGLYLLVGRFFVEAWRRAHTFYGVTSERAVILKDGLRRQVTSLPLDTLPGLQLREGRARRGTILLGQPTGPFGAMSGMLMGTGWIGASAYLPPAFEQIDDAREVYRTLESARRAR